jgi:hypothetical protein
MMIPELREFFCFLIFSLFRIIMTFFYMRHPSHWSFIVSGRTSV